MIKSTAISAKVTLLVINKKVDYLEAADLLEVSPRTMRNYVKWYLEEGIDGLIDRRRGYYRKVTAEHEQRIITCKAQRPHRSARWIRDWLKLDVSVEAVRKILLKHAVCDGRPRDRTLGLAKQLRISGSLDTTSV